MGSSGLALYGGAGFEVVFVTASFQSFGATSSSGDTTVGVAFEGGLEYPLGPGALTADLRYGEARANLGQAGQDSLGRALLTAGYALRF